MSIENLDILDAKLDDIDDLPEFAIFPAGAHRARATMEIKEVNGKRAVELSLSLIEHMELADPNDKALPEGSQSSVLYMLDNEYGVGNLKKVAKPFGEALGTQVLKEIIEQVRDIEVAVLTTVRTDKNDPDKKYLGIKELHVA